MGRRNKLTEAQEERFAIYVEEMGENLQILGKIDRHGMEAHNPFDQEKRTNKELLEKEAADVLLALELLCRAGDLDRNKVIEHARNKAHRLQNYLHHPENLKLLQRTANNDNVIDLLPSEVTSKK